MLLAGEHPDDVKEAIEGSVLTGSTSAIADALSTGGVTKVHRMWMKTPMALDS